MTTDEQEIERLRVALDNTPAKSEQPMDSDGQAAVDSSVRSRARLDVELPNSYANSRRKELRSRTSRTDEEWAPLSNDDPRPLIPEGQYQALCKDAKVTTLRMYKRRVAALNFVILGTGDGDHGGTPVQRFYRVADRQSRNSIYYREWTIANGGIPPGRRDRMPPAKFEGKVFKVLVMTVERAWDGKRHPKGLRYSKVAEIIELLATNEAKL